MTRPPRRPRTEFSITNLLPNMLTVAAICAGLTAIRFGVDGNYEPAVLLILLAAVLDGLDGRLARALGSDSEMGAELDSLADFLNFGVAPPLILYFWALQDMRGAAWISVLVFTVCCVVRLARFNATSKSDEGASKLSEFFTGVPAPAGAALVMLPMFASFSVGEEPLFPPVLIMLYMMGVGLLMISRIPTWSFKTARVSRENVKFFLVGFVAVVAALFTFAWTTLVILCLVYVGVVIWALLMRRPGAGS
ncbi:putative CDP-diacylglycerol--serine O-phosphatidyltransferase [Dinoroseobacter shibae DFL 12 = DSM 16493]|jgi:CDP-diacylglycerol--serine O-phosphatidyltransferase|uniref:CDP-diacylglycerol--serine O-phosphatidyltransferase n=2 Tax=Pseudomonadota TaxID=1224 RepID=A8LIK5_DINSH|nr:MULTISPECIES: CDP-diacylglycerol--serine O-phosphatidyltransferase [Dinoroseobacter]ABV94446.1 putative CDP-diacylglycerol--serine O-phosphatidyltransferase [Dinoroseobacter shibae DFL 12 = DSM 16493]MDD9717591.1 CDP-diacylglycerol--serine O-phosphatidyltransferase [Dinoroseobacter sp. PD6]URF45873.1 CDP-diacylglycerol--serine O-phosphatidyltransferase [Dinoroseobacter shibae]URF50180.1 CDP-diacylglycerol--serine O-phosphatidyltransferase [Dinoroseobacter shibae]